MPSRGLSVASRSSHGGSSDDGNDCSEDTDGESMGPLGERTASDERGGSRRRSVATEQLMELHELQGASSPSIASLSSNVHRMSIVSYPVFITDISVVRNWFYR